MTLDITVVDASRVISPDAIIASSSNWTRSYMEKRYRQISCVRKTRRERVREGVRRNDDDIQVVDELRRVSIIFIARRGTARDAAAFSSSFSFCPVFNFNLSLLRGENI